MRAISVVALAVCVALAAASVIPERTRKVADKELLQKQKQILQLLIRVHQPTYIPEFQTIADSYDAEKLIDHYEQYAHPYLYKMWNKYHHGEMLHRGEPFSVVYEKHIKQAVAMFNVLYGAKDYDTFFKTAVWMREHLNEGMFVYALSVAVIHRDDTHDIVLPPPYEVYPEFFVSAEVLHKAVEAKMQGHTGPITINAAQVDNASAWWLTYPQVQHPNHLLKYFTDDVGLSAYHTYLHYEYPFWFNPAKYGETPAPKRGEIFYFTMHQLFNRYYMERLSNGLHHAVEPVTLDFHNEHLEGYAPHLRYFNGQAMPSRPEGLVVSDIDILDVETVRKIERRLQDAIDMGVAFDKDINKVALNEKDGLTILGNMVAGNKESINKNFYGSLYVYLRALYGHISDPTHEHGVAPSVLEHFETAMRDPVYYGIIRRILELFYHYKSMLHSYTRDELMMPGVKIENVDVDKLVTYVDDFVFDLNSFLQVASEEEAHKLDVRVRQPRLNHKPFSVRVTVDSDKAARVAVRFFLAPKYNHLGQPLSYEERRQYAVETDRFFYDLQAGKNTIERSSRDSNAVVPDQTITRVLLKKVEDGIEGREPFYVDSSFRHCGFPERLLLPKGSRQGLPLTFFVAITPFGGDSLNTHRAYVSCGAGFGYQVVDDKPLGYPLDRPIKNEEDFFVPNMFVKDVIVFHKKQEEVNKA